MNVCQDFESQESMSVICRDLISSADTILEMSLLCERVVNNVKGLQVRSRI